MHPFSVIIERADLWCGAKRDIAGNSSQLKTHSRPRTSLWDRDLDMLHSNRTVVGSLHVPLVAQHCLERVAGEFALDPVAIETIAIAANEFMQNQGVPEFSERFRKNVFAVEGRGIRAATAINAVIQRIVALHGLCART